MVRRCCSYTINWCLAPEYKPLKPSLRSRRTKSLRLHGFHWLIFWLLVQVDALDNRQGVLEFESDQYPYFKHGSQFVFAIRQASGKCNYSGTYGNATRE